MQRKQALYLIAVLALLLSMLPVAAVAEEAAAPLQQTIPPSVEVLRLAGESGEGKASVSGAPFDGMAGMDMSLAPDGMSFFNEVEPNGAAATATALPATDIVVLGNIYPNGDLDYFSFSGNAGDRVYAAVMTSFSANASSDSQLRLFASDGTTEIEFDDDDGSLGGLSSSIAGATLPANGAYYLRVNHFSATNQLRPYRLHLKVQSGSPVAETEPNDTPATANALPASGWVSGARDPAAAAEQDWYSFTANAGDTVYLSLDLDPERDTVTWNGRLGIALFGDAGNQILVVDDASVVSPNSEALFMTVKAAGTYYAFVDSATGATGGPTATYNLSVRILPKATGNCTTYTSTDVPVTIGPAAGLVSSTITVPGNPRIADLDVSIQLDHALMGDIDAHLRSPAGNDNGLFTDIGAAVAGGQTQMDIVFDDEAAIPPAFTVLKGLSITPELAYRLSWFDGQNAGGVWTLDLRDDTTNTSGGALTGWSITVCEPPPPPVCPVGFNPVTVYSSDFESDDGGFTHSGTQDEWERGLPAFAPITTCNSGSNCWKTDLDDTYNASSNQTLLSPNINLAGLTGPVILRWAQKFQMENASFDGAYAQVQEVGGANPTRLWTWLDATMTSAVGNPTVTIQESAGWGERWADISSYAGQNIEALFNLSSDTTVQLAGLAIDDVSVTACEPIPAAPAITLDKTVGTDTTVCATTDQITLPYGGGSVTYCYEVTNTGDVTLNYHDLVDSELGALLSNFPYSLAPAASAFITETAFIGVTTVNTATWTAYNPTDGGSSAWATDAATVTVDLPAPAIVLTKTVGTNPLACATTDDITVPANTDVTYCYTVENTGNTNFNLHDLTDSELGALLTDFLYDLAPGASVFVTETATIAVTTVNTATWFAENVPAEGFPSAQATDTATVTVASAGPAIDLVKTVGTAPGVCAATDSIVVTAGTQVYYCYQVENTGSVTFNFHDLVDDQLGTILNDLPYVLAPGAFSPQVIIPDTPMATVTNVGTWTAMTALGTYAYDDQAPFNYIPINATGTPLGLADDGEANITIPFSFTFYGVTSSNLRVGNNGGILFNATTGDIAVTNTALPAASPALSILPFWDDIDSDTGDVYWEVQGTAPNRMLIVEWYNRPHYSNVGSATFQVILYETSNEIKYQYLDTDFGNASYDFGASATVGINKDATTALQYSFNQPVITNNKAIRIYPVLPVSATDTDTATVTVQTPNIDVSPLSLSETHLTPPQSTTQPLTVANTGLGTLTWAIAEEPTAVQPELLSGGDAAVAADVVDPSDFKAPEQASATTAAPLSDWRAPEAVLYDNGGLITNPTGGAGGAALSALQTALGLGTYGFGNQVSAGNRVADDFTVTGSGWLINTITFFGYQTGSTTTSTFTSLNLRIWNGPPNQGGSMVVFGDTTTNRLASSTWSNIYRATDTAPTDSTRPIMANVATVNTFLPAGTYWLDWQAGGTLASGPWAPPVTILGQTGKPGANALQFTTTGWAAVTDPSPGGTPQDLPFIVDGLADCANISDVPWLSVSPANGANTGGTNTPVTVTFNSASLAAGIYSANLCVTSNDPDLGPGNGTGLVIVPVTLQVGESTAVTLSDISAAPLPPAGLPLAALPAVIGLALGAAYALRRKE